MKVIYNRFIPFRDFLAVNLFGMIFARKGCRLNRIAFNHEAIHTAQMREMLFIPFYVWYITEWLLRLFCKGNAYENISFEREAYSNQSKLDYLSRRKRFTWRKYLIKR